MQDQVTSNKVTARLEKKGSSSQTPGREMYVQDGTVSLSFFLSGICVNGSDASLVYPTEAEKEVLKGIGNLRSITPISLPFALNEKNKNAPTHTFSRIWTVPILTLYFPHRKFSTGKCMIIRCRWRIISGKMFSRKACFTPFARWRWIHIGLEMCEPKWNRLWTCWRSLSKPGHYRTFNDMPPKWDSNAELAPTSSGLRKCSFRTGPVPRWITSWFPAGTPWERSNGCQILKKFDRIRRSFPAFTRVIMHDD